MGARCPARILFHGDEDLRILLPRLVPHMVVEALRRVVASCAAAAPRSTPAESPGHVVDPTSHSQDEGKRHFDLIFHPLFSQVLTVFQWHFSFSLTGVGPSPAAGWRRRCSEGLVDGSA